MGRQIEVSKVVKGAALIAVAGGSVYGAVNYADDALLWVDERRAEVASADATAEAIDLATEEAFAVATATSEAFLTATAESIAAYDRANANATLAADEAIENAKINALATEQKIERDAVKATANAKALATAIALTPTVTPTPRPTLTTTQIEQRQTLLSNGSAISLGGELLPLPDTITRTTPIRIMAPGAQREFTLLGDFYQTQVDTKFNKVLGGLHIQVGGLSRRLDCACTAKVGYFQEMTDPQGNPSLTGFRPIVGLSILHLNYNYMDIKRRHETDDRIPFGDDFDEDFELAVGPAVPYINEIKLDKDLINIPHVPVDTTGSVVEVPSQFEGELRIYRRKRKADMKTYTITQESVFTISANPNITGPDVFNLAAPFAYDSTRGAYVPMTNPSFGVADAYWANHTETDKGEVFVVYFIQGPAIIDKVGGR